MSVRYNLKAKRGQSKAKSQVCDACRWQTKTNRSAETESARSGEKEGKKEKKKKKAKNQFAPERPNVPKPKEEREDDPTGRIRT